MIEYLYTSCDTWPSSFDILTSSVKIEHAENLMERPIVGRYIDQRTEHFDRETGEWKSGQNHHSNCWLLNI